MKKCPFLILLFFIATGFKSKAAVTLTAAIEPGSSSVSLRWNMTNYYGTTAYVLLKSADGVNWQIAAANPVFRNYTSSTVLAYNDNFKNERKLFYRVRIYDTDDKTVALSNTAAVANPNAVVIEEKPRPATLKVATPWQIYPNPVNDMINLIYKGKDVIKGVINVEVQDATGKAVIKFRAASKSKQLNVSVSNLRSGIYFIKIDVLNEVQMNEKFVKQ
jgi:hypothetical protein